MSQSPAPRHIEEQIEHARNRLADTIDQLAYRTQPAVIAQRQKDSAVVAAQKAFTTSQGDLRIERVAMVAGAVALLVGIAIARRVRR